ncbi:hypothetical protein [Streptosporangium roseum]|uniref:hypothetical protein n=1 Tax=Streptosporangium roseum TaxID=2001 RepID=UPI0004CD0C42|nr:hypothetical protein [Streptosporangium roseum]
MQAPPSTRARALAPDLARGFMPLLIALAHAPTFIANAGLGPLDTFSQFLKVIALRRLSR